MKTNMHINYEAGEDCWAVLCQEAGKWDVMNVSPHDSGNIIAHKAVYKTRDDARRRRNMVTGTRGRHIAVKKVKVKIEFA
jgi:hypothetical protein